MLWFDAHLDLACAAVCGRDMTRAVADLDLSKDPHPPAAVTLPALRDGDVRFALATIFTEPDTPAAPGSPLTSTDRDAPIRYPVGNVERAHKVGRAQLEAYLTWRDRGLLAIDLPRILRADPGVGEMRGGMGVAELIPAPLMARAARLIARSPIPLHIGILMENADPIRTPDELPWWVERGVCAIGMAWWKPSRYATGNGSEPDEKVGLTDLGRALARAMDAQRVIHDLSHLSQRATDELLSFTDRPVIASHSNCRALLGGEMDGKNQRHLRDETIKEIARRGGVIGLNLFCKFLNPGASKDNLPTIADAVAHIEHICELVGHKNAVGLGSDMDGGITADELCKGIRSPSDLIYLADALRDRGWSDTDIAGFTHLNWMRFFEMNA